MRTATQRGRHATRMTRALALAGLVASASLTALPETNTVGAEPSPYISVNVGDGFVQIVGNDWPGDEVLVTVDDPTTAETEWSFEPVIPQDGQFGLEQQGVQADPGWIVTATDASVTKELTIVAFTIDRVDTSDGRAEGTAETDLELEIVVGGPDPAQIVNVTGDVDGKWSTQLSLPVTEHEFGINYVDDDGDLLSEGYLWPGIVVSLTDDIDEDGSVPDVLLGGGYWPAGAVVHMVVDDPDDVYDRSFDFDVTEWGQLDHWALGPTGIPNGVVGDGWTVTATTTFDGWTTEKTHAITDVRVNDTNHRTGIASGVCDPDVPGLYVGLVRGVWPGEGAGVLEGCDGGTWTIDWLVDQFDVPFVEVSRRDGDWDSTTFMNHQDRPRVLYEADTGALTFIYWNGEPVEVLLDGSPIATVPVSGELWYRTTLEEFGVPLGTVESGSTMTFQTPTELKAMVVQPVTIDAVDPDGTVHGTAPDGAEVTVGVENASGFGGPAEPGSVTADGEGNWSIQIDGFPLGVDHVIRATVLDFDDDANIAEFEPSPQIVVRPIDNVVVGLGFQQGETVTVVIDDDGDPDNGVLFSVDREIQDPRQAHLELFDEQTGEEFDVVAGQFVTVAGDSGTATHEVTELTTTGADAEFDVVAGTAAAGSEVVVNVNDEPVWRVVVAEQDGAWTAEFADEPVDPVLGAGDADLQPGMEGQAEQHDDAGNATAVAWRVPNPTLEVDPFEDIVVVNDLVPGIDVDISVNGAPAGSATAEPWGDNYWQAGAWIDVYPAADMSAGDVVEATASSGEVVTMTVSPLTVDGSDTELQVLTGTANPGADVFIHGGSDASDAQRRVTADEAGRWAADFATEPEPDGEGQEPPGYGTVDLAGLRWLDVGEVVGEVGTTIYRRDERPTLFMFPAERTIWTFNWYPLDPIDLSITDGTGIVHEVVGLQPQHGPSSTTIADVTFDLPGGNPRASVVYELPEGVDLHPGGRVTVSDALMTVTGVVGDVAVDEANLVDETLSGTTTDATGFVVALDADGHVGPVEPSGGAWTTPLCTPDSLDAGGCDETDLTHESAGIVLAFPSDESIDETATGTTWSMAPQILSVDAPATAEFKTETTVVVTIADIERPDTQSVTIDWGEKKNDNDMDTSTITLSDPDAPTEIAFAHTYKVKGTVTATVTVTDARGSTSTQTFTIEITKQ